LTLLEVILSSILLFTGGLMLYEASLNKSSNEAAILVGGAACFSLSLTIQVSAVKSLVCHRQMLRHAMPKHHLDAGGAIPYGVPWKGERCET
jgi:hypothetical protein